MARLFFSACGFDGGRSGISVYMQQVLLRLVENHQVTVLADAADLPLLPRHPQLHYRRLPAGCRRPLWNMLYHLFWLPWLVSPRKYDCLLLPAANRRACFFHRLFTIAVVHDLSQYHVEAKYDCFRMFYIKYLLPHAVRLADVVVAISGSTRDDLIRYWRVAPAAIRVNYNGFDRRTFHAGISARMVADAKSACGIDGDYLLYISRIEHPGKNHLRLIQAYEKLPADLRARYLLVLGGGRWNGADAVLAYAANSPCRDRIRFIGFVPNEALPGLYRGAALYVFPSLFEGFGLSIPEAMACEVPVACSNNSSLGEIAGDGARQFDPCDVDAIAGAIREVLCDQSLRERLRDNAARRLELFDWDRHARLLNELIELQRLVGSGKPGNRSAVKTNKFMVSNQKSYRWRRCVETLLAAFFYLVLTLPLVLLLSVRRLLTGEAVFETRHIFGRNGVPTTVHYLRSRYHWIHAAGLFGSVLRGKLNLFGVSMRDCRSEERTPGDAVLFGEAPGVFNLYFIRRSNRLTHVDRLTLEQEYLQHKSWRNDFGLLARSFPALLFRSGDERLENSNRLLGIRYDNFSMSEALEAVTRAIERKQAVKIAFVNADCFNQAWKNQKYHAILSTYEFIFPDGIGLVIAGKLIRRPLKANINGTDMLPFLCRLAEEKGFSFYFLGAAPGVAEKMSANLQKQYPRLRIAGWRDGFFTGPEAEKAAVAEIARCRPDLLLVAMGVPRQETFIAAHWPELHCQVAMGVGGLFDFYSGNIPRAPLWLREIGMEWAFRLYQEPFRLFKRYVIGNPLFLWRVVRFGEKYHD